MTSFLDPKVLASIGDLPLIARHLAHGFLQGPHASMMRGTGIEFSQYRAYEPGDDLAKLDWKLFARSDKYFIRQAERESDINIHFVCDTSASMLIEHSVSQAAGQEQEEKLSKIQYAQMLVATLAYMANQQGDSVALSANNSIQQTHTAMANSQRHLQRLMVSLAQIQCEGAFPGLWRQDLERLVSANLIVVVTDFAQQNDEIIEYIESLAGKNREVIVFQLLSEQEMAFNFSGLVRFVDPESGKQKIINAERVKQQFMQRHEHYLKKMQQRTQELGIQLHPCVIESPLDETLRQFLLNRIRVR